MHAALFAGLALCMTELLSGRPKRQASIVALIVIASAAIGQEAIQFASTGVLPVVDTLFDLCVDVLSGGVAVIVARHFVARLPTSPAKRTSATPTTRYNA